MRKTALRSGLFSLHYEASLNGGTVVRPMFFEFPSEHETHELWHQFMWGNSMMIVAVVTDVCRP